MAQETTPLMLFDYTAVRLEDNIVVFGNILRQSANVSSKKSVICTPTNDLWVCNLYTDQWKKYVISDNNEDLFMNMGYGGITIGQNIYMFRTIGNMMGALWTLAMDRKGCFSRSKILVNKPPSYRSCATGWGHDEKLWLFAGIGASPADVGYLNDFVDFDFVMRIDGIDYGLNNQLICFDPLRKVWSNLKCGGVVPSPRHSHVSTVVGDEVYVYGGMEAISCLFDLYKLNMTNFSWTQIQTETQIPKFLCSISPITKSKLVFHGYYSADDENNTTWILDLPSLSWREYTVTMDRHRKGHTSVTWQNSSAIIIGGVMDNTEQQEYQTMYCIRLEPKSLQHVAIKTIYENHATLPSNHLPPKLIQQILGTSPEEDYTDINSKLE